MALLYPCTPAALRLNGGLYRELDVLDRLQQSLPDGYGIFHGVELHTVRGATDHFGEIDIIVMGPNGALLLMEVKAGAVSLRDGQVYKLYGADESDVSRQCRVQRASLLTRLGQAGLDTSLASCLVIPDYCMGDEEALSVPRERIVDANRYPQLGTFVRELLSQGRGCTQPEALRRFLLNQFRVSVDLSAARDQLARATRILSDGLATWVPRMSAPSGVFRISATAGSGKTQLALTLIERALADGQAVSYVSYNRTLADHMRALAPLRAEVINFHELAVDYVRRRYGEPDFTAPQVLEAAAAQYAADSEVFAARLDVLIIDEGQDFEPAWISGLCQLLRPGGSLYLMEDDDQRLYPRPGFEIAEAVTVVSRENYRSPRLVCEVINALDLCATPVTAMSHFRGELPGFHVYASAPELLIRIEQAVAALLARGFAPADIVVLSNCGRASSALTGVRRIGGLNTRMFTGAYSRTGDPVWTDGELLVESVYRYKGQSAPAVVLAEVAFSELSAHEKKKLFVGMTRAQMVLEIVLTPEAEHRMMAAISSDVRL